MVIRMSLLKYGAGTETDFSDTIQMFVDETLPMLPAEVLHTESNLTFDVVNQAGACHMPADVPSTALSDGFGVCRLHPAARGSLLG